MGNNNTGKSFNLRAFASVFAGLSFLLMAVTGLVLFFAPSCRIARETSWMVWGHNKEQWVAVHVWLSIAFVIASITHIYINWTALTNYFKSRIHKQLALRPEWIAALAICVVLCVGSVRGVTPFSSLMAWKETFKHPVAESGHGWRGGRVVGQQIENDASHTQQGQAHGAFNSNGQRGDLQQTQGPGGYGPGRAGGGMGQKTLRQFCSDEGAELTWAMLRLRNEGFTVQDTMTMRQIADGAGIHPRELRGILGLEKDHDY
ncbi:MAG: DUF4405 domain-containing protein [Planctomycetota bacterium]